jgi:hypothetical protein
VENVVGIAALQCEGEAPVCLRCVKLIVAFVRRSAKCLDEIEGLLAVSAEYLGGECCDIVRFVELVFPGLGGRCCCSGCEVRVVVCDVSLCDGGGDNYVDVGGLCGSCEHQVGASRFQVGGVSGWGNGSWEELLRQWLKAGRLGDELSPTISHCVMPLNNPPSALAVQQVLQSFLQFHLAGLAYRSLPSAGLFLRLCRVPLGQCHAQSGCDAELVVR